MMKENNTNNWKKVKVVKIIPSGVGLGKEICPSGIPS
jgi:hypothetical protein